LLAAAASMLLLQPGCSSAGGGFRLWGTSAARSRAAQEARGQQSFDLMSARARTKAGDDSFTSERDARKTLGARISPDGRWVAYEAERAGVHGVWVARRDGSEARRISGTSFAALPSWSPDGSRLLFVSRQTVRSDAWSLWTLEMHSARVSQAASLGGYRIAGASWFPDSRRVCYGSDTGLVVLDVASRSMQVLRVPAEALPIVGVPAVSPEGGRVVFAVSDSIWIASLGDGRVQRLLNEPDVDAFAWAPGGSQIVFRTARDAQWKVYVVQP
jgi:Tol biopolymer transport system component